MDWDGRERRKMPFCEAHVKLCEDIAVIKTTCHNIDKRINGSIEDIKIHIEHSGKWRLAIVALIGGFC